MARLFVVVVALFAVCQSSPVLINGVETRDGRAFNYGVGQSASVGGSSTATASVSGRQAQAYGKTDNAEGPNNAVAQVGSSDNPAEIAIPRAQPFGYYPVPAVNYQQKYIVPQNIAYQVPAAGYNRAASDAYVTPQGSAAKSYAQSDNAVVPVVVPEPAVILAKAQPLRTVYVPSVGAAQASSNAQPGRASSAASTGPARKSISWRFGTAYDTPATGYVIKSEEAPAIVPADVSGYANLQAKTITQGQAAGDSTAYQNGFGSVAASKSQSSGLGSSNSDASVGPYGSLYYRNNAWNSGRIATKTLSSGNGSSAAKAQNLGSSHIVNSISNSYLGGAASSAAQSI